jgi:soluble lytic murein transglycosylase
MGWSQVSLGKVLVPAAVVLLLGCAAAPGLAASGRSAMPASLGADDAVLAARDAARNGDQERLAALAPLVSGHVLEAYPEYWRISLRVKAGQADESEVRAFQARYPGSWLADRLRGDWLQALGARQQFAAFEAESRAMIWGRDDPQFRCYHLLARYSLEDPARRDEAAREARRLLASASEPGGDGCSALADRLVGDGALSIWPRLQALVERNQMTAARRAATRLSEAEQSSLHRVLERPGSWLAGYEHSAERAPRELAVLAIVNLAREDPERAAHFATAWNLLLSPEQRGVVWGRIGHVGAQRLHPSALEWYLRGGELVGAGLDYVRAREVLESEVRAALRAPDGPQWGLVLTTISRMPPEQQGDPAWVYWRARALAAQGQGTQAEQLLQTIDHLSGFYGRLAAEDLGLPLQLAPEPPAPSATEVDMMAARPGFQRALRLYELGMRDEANHEWGWELRGMNDWELLAAAEYARRQGVLDRMIASSERTRSLIDMAQRFPMPHRELLAEVAAPLGMDQAWIYGLIRQESRFVEDVHSSSGAIGLMQLLPTTARYVARRIGLDGFHPARVATADVNLRLGVNYLKLVSDDQDGQPALASAAYNAGPRRLREWRASLAAPLEGSIFVETIPIAETRDYVKKVLFNTVIYGELIDRREPSLRTILGTITPKAVPANDLP